VDSEFPGVYVLAYSTARLNGKPIEEREIFYVGVSHAGVKGRLKQFINGLEDGGHHSGAKRFFFDPECGKKLPVFQAGEEEVVLCLFNFSTLHIPQESSKVVGFAEIGCCL
jgi:hypothetical protein